MFDAAVNSGPGRALRWLQAEIGATVDGVIGNEMRSQLTAPTRSSRPARMQSCGRPPRWSRGPKRGPAHREIPRPSPLTMMERIPPQESRRDEETLFKTTRAEPFDKELSQPGRGVPSPYRRPERLHSTCQAGHGCRRIRGKQILGHQPIHATKHLVQPNHE